MNQDRFAEIITKQSVEMQNAIFAGLKEVLSEEDYKTVVQFVGLYDMMHNPLKYEAMKKAVLEMLTA
jgi:hypothetical protein